MKHFVYTIVLSGAMATCAFANPSVAQAELKDDNMVVQVKEKCSSLLKEKKFTQLNSYIKKLEEDFSQDSDGVYLTISCLRALDKSFKVADFDEWKKATPNNIYPVVAKHFYATREFFNLRGEESIAHTPKEKLVQAFNFLHQASQEVESVKKFGTSPLWYQTRLKIAFYEPQREVFLIYLKDATSKYPDYYSIHGNAAENMAPQWGYSHEDLDDFATYSMEHSALKEKMYALIYRRVVTPCCSKHITQAGHFKPEVFYQGATQFFEQFPTLLNSNTFAQTACLLNDRKTATYLIKNEKFTYIPRLWDTYTYAKCMNFINGDAPTLEES